MGFYECAYWLSGFTWESFLMLIASLFTVVFGMLFQFNFFMRNSFAVLFLVFFLFQLNMLSFGCHSQLSFAFLISTFVDKSSSGSTFVFSIFIVGFLTQIHCKDVVIEDTDVANAIVEFVSQAAIEKLVVGAPSKGGFIRFKSADISSHMSKGAPDFCTVYVISKGKLLSTRNAVRPAPEMSPLRVQIQSHASFNKPDTVEPHHFLGTKGEITTIARNSHDESIKTPFTRGGRVKSHTDLLQSDSDISSRGGRASTYQFSQDIPMLRIIVLRDLARHFALPIRTHLGMSSLLFMGPTVLTLGHLKPCIFVFQRRRCTRSCFNKG